jgi:D-aspartate ligase
MTIKQNHIEHKLPPVVLLGGGVIALSIGRSLSKIKVHTIVLDDPDSEAYYSRFCKVIPLSPADRNQSGWYRWLINEGKALYPKPLLIPCCDEGLTLIAEHRDELGTLYKIIEGEDKLTLALLDKLQTYELARKHNMPVPETWIVNSIDDLIKLKGTIQYPCALKPRESHLFAKHFPKFKLFVVDSEEELFTNFEETQLYKLRMIVTEMIPAAPEAYHSYYTYIDENGQPLFHFTKLRIRQHPNLFGLGTYNISNWNPEVAELGLRFIKSIGLKGIGTVEFIRDARDGSLKFIECNPRFTGTTELLPLSGLDWPLLVYNHLTGKPLPPVEYNRGVRLFRIASDFLAFRELHRNKKLSWMQWIKSIAYYQHFFYFRWNDPLPFFSRLIPFFKRRIHKIFTIVKIRKEK